jgi:hypothetical protein
MTRLARRASLLTAFSLLTSAATAYAECAWVIWGTRDSPEGGSFSTFPIEARETRKMCEERMWSEIAYAVQQGVAKREGGGAMLVYKDGKTVAFRCLPDTVDPRGVKGK